MTTPKPRPTVILENKIAKTARDILTNPKAYLDAVDETIAGAMVDAEHKIAQEVSKRKQQT